jgi:hypothetical protein
MVGGFSMGGLVSRYALAKLEAQCLDHQTSVYISFDSPHFGAWIPISLQNLAHFLKATPVLSKQINSPASRQLLWVHVEEVNGPIREDPLRTQFLAELKQFGNWPQRPRLLAVASGTGDNSGNGVPAGQPALNVNFGFFNGTELLTQASGDAKVARLKGLQDKEIRTLDLPALDGASGGTLESFGIAGDKLKLVAANKVEIHHRLVNFVPTASAVARAEPGFDKPLKDEQPESFEVDDYFFSETNTLHASMTPEIAQWVFDRLP